MSIQDELNKWVSSPAGKKKIAKARMDAFKAGKPFGGGPAGRKQSPMRYADEMIDCVLKYLPDSLRHSDTPITRDSFEAPVLKTSGDACYISLSFNPDAVHRDSLVPELWKQGIENIVVHLSNGWSAKGAVNGDWHGTPTVSRMEYSGDDFMREAVDEFNREHPEAYAELGVEYQ